MKKRILFLFNLSLISPLALIVACSGNSPQTKITEVIDFNNFSKKSFNNQFKDASKYYDDIVKGKVKSYKTGTNTQVIDYSDNEKLKKSTKGVSDFYKKYFPSFLENNNEKNLNSGIIPEFNKNYKMPADGSRLTINNMPKAPDNAHWVFNSDNLYKDKDVDHYWARKINYFRIPMMNTKNSYHIKAKLEADFGYLLNNDDTVELIWTK